MRTKRGRSDNLIRSFRSLPRPQLANKENSFILGLSPVSRPRILRRRRFPARTIVASPPAIPQYRLQPSYDNDHMATPNPQPELPVQARVSLPRRLPRPRYRPIDPHVISAIDPLLDNIPINYIQHTLEDIGPQLLQTTNIVAPVPPLDRLPRQMQIICNDVSTEPPSHVLAVYSRTDGPPRGVILFPAHALVLAANCAHLPSLPISKPEIPAESGSPVTLPVVALRVPSYATFSTLLTYLYTKRSDRIFAELLPLPMSDEAESMERLARKHAAAFTAKTLLDCAQKVHGLWNNISALGIFDDNLFQTMDMTWDVLLNALAIKSNTNSAQGIGIDVG